MILHTDFYILQLDTVRWDNGQHHVLQAPPTVHFQVSRIRNIAHFQSSGCHVFSHTVVSKYSWSSSFPSLGSVHLNVIRPSILMTRPNHSKRATMVSPTRIRLVIVWLEILAVLIFLYRVWSSPSWQHLYGQLTDTLWNALFCFMRQEIESKLSCKQWNKQSQSISHETVRNSWGPMKLSLRVRVW